MRRTPPAWSWPEGKAFAFSILDDTDDGTVENTKPLYDLLDRLGMRTTKTVWPVACPEGSRLFFAGKTMADPGYRKFILDLEDRGFEIAFHCATMESSRRSRTVEALNVLTNELKTQPRLHCNHGQNRENLYWGHHRYRSLIRHAVGIARKLKRQEYHYDGHVPDSPYFWGDLSLDWFDYVRSFAFARFPLPRWLPLVPYRSSSTPYVKRWFVTSDAPDATAFHRLLKATSTSTLARHGGPHIVSTHLGKGFVKDGKVGPEIERILRMIAEGDGWFAPVSDILDHLAGSGERKDGHLGSVSLLALDIAHLIDRVSQRVAGRS